MSIAKLQALFVAAESSFGTEPDADGSDYAYVHAQDVTFKPDKSVIDRPLQDNTFDRQAHVMGAKGGTLSFKLEARGTGTAATDGVAAVAGEAGLILKSCFGTQDLDTGDVTAADCTTTLVKVATSGARFSVGNLIGVDVSSTYGIQVRRITAISTNDITVSPAMSAAPAAARVVHAAANFRPATSGHVSLAFCIKGDGREFTALGCKGNVKFDGMAANGRGMFDFSFSVDSWTETTKASLPAQTDAITVAAPPVLGSPLWVAGTSLPVAEFSLDLGNALQPQPSTAATTGRADIVVVDRKTGGSLKPYFASANLTAFTAATEQELLFQVGATAGDIYAFAVPKAQFTAHDLADTNSLLAQALNWAANASGVTNVPTVVMGLL